MTISRPEKSLVEGSPNINALQMQIPEMLSYVGMKETLTQRYKMEERVQTEHSLAAQTVYKQVHLIYKKKSFHTYVQ